MAPPPPPGWQPYNPHFHPLDGPPYPEYDHYHGDEQYNEFEEEVSPGYFLYVILFGQIKLALL